jgi:lipid II:glycine glycyltransferase (peptidoglycan interpeptide bridge formation enzyme)
MGIVSAEDWAAHLAYCPEAHLLQTADWGALKSNFGWQVEYLIDQLSGIGAQILFRHSPLGFSIAYIAKGPVILPGKSSVHWGNNDHFLIQLDAVCRAHRAIMLIIEPDEWETMALSRPKGLQKSAQSIQPPRTIIISLNEKEDLILGRMKQKTRYNIRLAQRKGVVVRQSDDINEFYRLLKLTGNRDAFNLHSQAYYQKTYDLFAPIGQCVLLIAELGGVSLAGIMVFARGRRAWYFYGASAEVHREMMPAYLLQWEAMRWAKNRGCGEYDLWGVPDESESVLESSFTSRSDSLWGVYRFKRGFGGELRRSAGPWERVYNPIMHQFYRLYRKNAF